MCSNPLPAIGRRKPGSVGTTQGSITVAILDDESKVTTRPTVVGEVVIQGPSIMSGYVNREDATKEAFVGEIWGLSLQSQ